MYFILFVIGLAASSVYVEALYVESPESSELDEGTEVCRKNGVVCPEYDGEFPVYASIDYGKKFCECSNGRPYLFSCPADLLFNSKLNVCDYPESREYNAVLGNPIYSVESSELNEGTEICKKNGVVCPEYDGEFPVYASIDYGKKFCECSNGRPYLFSCPADLLFNSKLNVCDYPESREYNAVLGNPIYSVESSELNEGTEICKKNGVVCPEYDGEFPVYASIDYGKKFCECSNGRPYLFSCPADLLFNSKLNVCDYPESREYNAVLGNPVYSVESSELNEGTEICKKNGVVCPEYDGEFPVYASIDYGKKFCECSNGRPYLFSCPADLLFNSKLNVCDYPESREYNAVLGNPVYSVESSELNEGTEICKKNGVVCPEYDGEFPVYASIDYGKKFCECSNGRPYLFSCPADLLFNSKLNVCDYPESREYNAVLGNPVYSVESSELNEGTEICKKNGVVCPEYDGEFPVYASIDYGKKFCECSNGRPYLFSCPADLLFNSKLNVCDYPESREYNAVLGNPVYSVESSELNEGTEICKKNGVVCPEYDGEFPVYASIDYGKKFCECSNGRPYLFSCPADLLFNTKLNVCDYPESYESVKY